MAVGTLRPVIFCFSTSWTFPEISLHIIAALTGAGCRAGKRSLHVRCPVSGQVPCSGARRRGKALDAVSAAIPRDAVARNDEIRRGGSDLRYRHGLPPVALI